jgi:multidrug efflux pump subunit AcrB
VKNLLYFESSVDASGSAQITATFKPGTDPELAQMDVQTASRRSSPATGGAANRPAGGVRLVRFSDDGRHDFTGWPLR